MKRLLTPLVVLAIATLLPQAAGAQGRRPYRGLFGGGIGNMEQSLVFTMSLGGGYDSSVLVGDVRADVSLADQVAEDGVVTAAEALEVQVEESQIAKRRERLAGGSSMAMGTAGLGYSLARTRVALTSSVNATALRYDAVGNKTLVAYTGVLTGMFRPWFGSTLAISQNASYQPFYNLLGRTMAITTPGADVGLIDLGIGGTLGQEQVLTEDLGNHLYTSTNAQFSQPLTRRVSLTGSYYYQGSQSPSRERNLVNQSVIGGLSIGLGRGLGARVGYGYSEARYTVDETRLRFSGRTIDAGLSFDRALSLSRRTRLNLTSGTSAVGDASHKFRYFFTGSAVLAREIARSWSANLSYTRSVSYFDVVQQPVVGDSVALSIGGLLTRRLKLQTTGGTSFGRVGLLGPSQGFKNYFANTGLQVALTRLVGIGVNYAYYRYWYDASVPIELGAVREGQRHQVSVYGNVLTPLFTRKGRSHATR